MYSYNFTVKKTGSGEWTIFAENGNVLHVMSRVSSVQDATERATAWGSSWSSVSIKVEDEQDKRRD